MSTDSSKELLRSAAEGDERAWSALVDRYGALVWNVARGQGLTGEAADDAAQTTWLKLAENLDRIRNPERLAGWLATTARNASMDIHRRNSRLDLYEDVPEDSTVDSDIDLRLLESERDTTLWRAFRSLSMKCQELLRLLVSEPDLTYDDIGNVLQMPVGSIGPTRRRCLETLEKQPRVKELHDGVG